jgi:hypothetical protein
LNQRLHDHGIVIHIAKQNRLVAERNPGICQSTQGVAHFGGEFARVIRMHTDEKRMEFLEHLAKGGRNALREEDGNARTDPEKLNVLDGAKLAEKISQLIIAQQQGVSTAEENVANGRRVADVFDLLVELRMEIISGGVADKARAGAVTAIGGTAIGNEKEHAIWITMHQTGHGRMRIFPAGIAHFPRRAVRFFDARNDLPANGTELVGGIDQIEEIGRDGHRELGICENRPGALLGRE